MKFAELDIEPEIQSAIQKLGFEDCTPIQESTIPKILQGLDVAGLAQTGTGKTAAFLLPLMDRILKSGRELEKEERAFKDWQKNHFILILVPTRELAEQVYDNFQKLKGDTSLRGVAIYGGVAYDKQKAGLKEGVEFVIATPGRLIDLFKEHQVDLRQVRAVVFDEADRMFDMGFKDDMKYLLQRIPRERQFLVYSATLNFDVLNVAYQFGSDPVECNISKDQPKADNVEDEIFHVGHNEKPSHLLSLLKFHQPKQAIIFSNFKFNVGRIAAFLNANGIPAVGISSLLTQAQRNRVMSQFKGDNEQNILVATDVAARGLDIKGVDLVINYEMPDDPENYVHRIGRTGRAGAKGKAFGLVSDRDVDALARIEDYLKHRVTIGWLEDEHIVKEFKPFPAESREVRSPARGKQQRDRRDRDGGGGKGNRRKRPERDRDRDRDRAKGKGGGASPENRSAASGVASPAKDDKTHRDRKTGRHKPRNGKGAPASSANAGHRRPENKRTASPARPQNRPSRPMPSSPAKEASIGKKIGGFFKKLFG